MHTALLGKQAKKETTLEKDLNAKITQFIFEQKGVKVGRTKQEGRYDHDNCETISLQSNKIIHVTTSYLNA